MTDNNPETASKNLLRRVVSDFHGLIVGTGFFGTPKDPLRHWDHAAYILEWERDHIQLYRVAFPYAEGEMNYRFPMTFEEFDNHYNLGQIKQNPGKYRILFKNGQAKYILLPPVDFERRLYVWDGEEEHKITFNHLRTNNVYNLFDPKKSPNDETVSWLEETLEWLHN